MHVRCAVILFALGCTGDKEGGSEGTLDPGPDGSAGSTGAGNMGGEGTESSPYTGELPAGDPVGMRCVSAPVPISEDHFPSEGYYGGGSIPGDECFCDFWYDSGGESFYLAEVVVTGELTSSDHMPWGIAGTIPWDDVPYTLTVDVTEHDDDDWRYDFGLDTHGGNPPVNPSGQHEIWMSALRRDTAGSADGYVSSCAEYPIPVWLYTAADPARTSAPVPTIVDIAGTVEGAASCSSGASDSTVFMLGPWVGASESTLYFQSGAPFAGALTDTVTVTEWGDATFIRMTLPTGGTTTLTPSSSSAAFAPGEAAVGRVSFESDGWPTLQVAHTCPPTSPEVVRSPGYAFTLGDVSSAVLGQTATAALALTLDPGLSARFVARIVDGSADGSKHLFVELEGMDRAVGVALAPSPDPSHYTFVVDAARFAGSGSVTVGSDGLSVLVSEGSFETHDGDWHTLPADLSFLAPSYE